MSLIYIIEALLAFSVLVIVHELGHFTLAKLNGVKVEEFSLGMGPKLFGIKGKETEYIIKAFPIGGYVKMLGEEEKSSDERSFTSKKPGQRLSIIAAGPIMNFILAILLFALFGYMRGIQVPVVSELQKDSPAAVAGIEPGDKITNINGKNISTWDDLTTEIFNGKGTPLTLKINRSGNEVTKNITPMYDEQEKRYIIGILPTTIEKPSFGQSLSSGIKTSGSLIKQTFSFFASAFQGKASANDVGGPITIIKVSTQAAAAGILPLVYFTAFLSVQLAIFNIIPFPALDGGWIFILLFEMITRKKIDDKKIAIVNYIGFAILMTLMVLVVIKDILYPIKFN